MAKRGIKSVEDILTNPNLLENKTPKEIEIRLSESLPENWKVEKLRKGSQKGNGWVMREYKKGYPFKQGNETGRVIRWHPGGGRHGTEPYWRVNDYRTKSKMIPAGSDLK